MAKDWVNNGGYKTNDYLYADDINKMINLFNSFIVFDSNNEFAGIKIPKNGLDIHAPDGTVWKLTVDNDGILQTTASN